MEDIKRFLDGLLLKSSPDRPAWNQEVLLGHIEPVWNYIDGCMIQAVLEMYYATRDKSYLDFADSFMDYFVDEAGGLKGYVLDDFNGDNINEGKVLFDLYRLTGKGKYRKGIETLYRQIQAQPRTRGGNFWHKKIYPYQVWLDGLYMFMPFYAEYEACFNQGRNFFDIVEQFGNVHDLMRDPKTALLYHGYDESRECFWADRKTGCSPNFWTRSLGWYAMALVDTLEKFNDNSAACGHRLLAQLVEVLDALLAVADPETGMFRQVTNLGRREGNYLETSGTCAIAFVLMKGARRHYLPEKYFSFGERILRSVIECKLVLDGDDFTLRDICLVAGLGGAYPGRGDYKMRDGSYEYYISEPRVDNDAKGVAPFLFAFAELYRSENGQ